MLFLEAMFESWSPPVLLSLAVVIVGLVYLRGWRHLHLASPHVITPWRASSFLLGVFLIWMAIGSPLAALDEQFLTVHMLQHLLLMTIAPALILLGAPVMPLMHGLPRYFMRFVLAPLFRRTPVQRLGRLLSQPVFCWIAAAAALVGWHIPAAFTLGLQSESWHGVEHACFLGAGLLFWWPVVRPWPGIPVWPRWSILVYLFLATLPCDILSGFLVFCDRVVYPVYFSAHRHSGMSVLEDQQCAGALMWACITILYLVPAVILTTGLLGAREARSNGPRQSEPHPLTAHSSDPQSVEGG